MIDFGQSFDAKNPPTGYVPATAIHYHPPETLFDGRFSLASDIWVLACAIFEIRAGETLFTTFFADKTTVVRDAVQLLGKLPDPWWNAFEHRHLWFDENGQPKDPDSKSSIREELRDIGEEEDPPRAEDGPMIETVGTRLEEEEVVLLGDLLEKMLKYDPEERITIQEVVRHPWFEYTDGACQRNPSPMRSGKRDRSTKSDLTLEPEHFESIGATAMLAKLIRISDVFCSQFPHSFVECILIPLLFLLCLYVAYT